MVVTNDGVFSFCSAHGLECPDEPPCNVHAYLKAASETKRELDDTTGAFGIGFTAVYQITDRPEMVSAGLHITLRPEEANEPDRVIVCPGCAWCRDQSGTMFRLPWARQGSELRRRLRQEPRWDPHGMTSELAGSLRDALLIPEARAQNRRLAVRALRPRG